MTLESIFWHRLDQSVQYVFTALTISIAIWMLRLSCTKSFTKHLVKSPVQNGIRLGLTFASTLRAGNHLPRQLSPILIRSYAQQQGGGFPGFSLGPQHQKGEALKEYVSHSHRGLSKKMGSMACKFRVLI